MSSTGLGVIVGVVIAAVVTTHYGDDWAHTVRGWLPEELGDSRAPDGQNRGRETGPTGLDTTPGTISAETAFSGKAETARPALVAGPDPSAGLPGQDASPASPDEGNPVPVYSEPHEPGAVIGDGKTVGPEVDSGPASQPPGISADVTQQERQASRQDTNSAANALAPDTLERRWAVFAAEADSLEADGDYPWRDCFTRAAAAYEVPEVLLLAIASGESSFDPAARSDKDAIGLMQIRWPTTSRHLGVFREADLYDPCTNVAAGARYMAELNDRFGSDLHRSVAAYNYGPTAIEAGAMPQGARWYSQYIYQHLQRILGRPHAPTSELISPATADGVGYEVLYRFNQPYRAREIIAFIETQVPGLELAQRSESLGQHEVVLLYRDESQRLRALDSLQDAGLALPGQHIGIPRTF